MNTRFTDRTIKAIKPKEKRFEVWETNGKGFGIRIHPSGKKSWVFLYRFHGKSRRMTFGEYPFMPLADAHAEHAKALRLLRTGVDPAATKQEERWEQQQAPTVDTLIEEYLEKWAKPRKRSWQEDKRNLYKDVKPAWGHRKAKDINRRDVLLLLDSIIDRGALRQSNIVFSVIRRMFNFAIERDIIEYSPCDHIKPRVKETPRDRILSADEVKAFIQGLDHAGISGPIKLALKLILITAQRPGEVLGAHSSEFDGIWWTLPAERAKNGVAHRVYLSDLARKLIGPIPDGFLFPSPRGSKPIHVNALASAIRRNVDSFGIPHFTPHDLRRTAASNIAGLGFGNMVGKILNHKDRSVTAVYDHYNYDREKKQALDAWSRKLETLISPSPNSKIIRLQI